MRQTQASIISKVNGGVTSRQGGFGKAEAFFVFPDKMLPSLNDSSTNKRL
jgi:hypothetical protein